jgi:Ni/Fe-hydrogenase 1 B-type cytochrome subunit
MAATMPQGGKGQAGAEHRPHYLSLPPGAKKVPEYVYQWPVRLWHWITMLAIIALFVTGFMIGRPPPSIGGEASDHFMFGYIRMIHFSAGYILAVAFVARIYMAITGNEHARQLFMIPFWDPRWYGDVLSQVSYYLFLNKEPRVFLGHNPLAQAGMFFMFLLPVILIIVTGLALFAEGAGMGSWQYQWFGWILAVPGGSFAIHTVHRITMWLIVLFSMIHIYLCFREDIMSEHTVVSTMVSGWRLFKPGKEPKG